TQRLNQEAAKAIRAGAEAGITISRADAVKWLTLNPATARGIEKMTGSREAGKNADVVIWSGDPFSAYAHAERVFIDGVQMFDRADFPRTPRSAFQLGLLPPPPAPPDLGLTPPPPPAPVVRAAAATSAAAAAKAAAARPPVP